MKISDVVIVPLTAPYTRPNTQPDYPANGVRNCVWVRVETDSGVSGWGEAYCGCYATEVTIAALQRLSRIIIGKTPIPPSGTLAEMRFRNRYWAMRGIGAQATSALEAALWDIAGKEQQTPVWSLLGDGKERPVMLYASAGESILSPEEIYDEGRAFVAQGFHAYKIRCGGRLDDRTDHLKRDADRTAAAREALGTDGILLVDIAVPQKAAHWDHARVKEYMETLAPFRIGFLEEPAMTYDVQAYRRLRQLELIGTAGGESFASPEEFDPFFEAGAYSIVQPDAAVVGGPASCVEVIENAARHSVPVAIHAWSAGIGIAQNIHAACARDGVILMEWPMSDHPPAWEPIRGMWNFRDGMLQPPVVPGLGVNITEELLQSYPLQPQGERDF